MSSSNANSSSGPEQWGTDSSAESTVQNLRCRRISNGNDLRYQRVSSGNDHNIGTKKKTGNPQRKPSKTPFSNEIQTYGGNERATLKYSVFNPQDKKYYAGSSFKYEGNQAARPKFPGLNEKHSQDKKYDGLHRGDRAQHRSSSVCGGNNSRQRSPSRDGRRNQRFQSMDRRVGALKFPSVNKENIKREICKIPRNLSWLVDLSELSGLEIVAKLANSHSGFQNIIKDITRLKQNPDLLILTIKLLAKVCDADFKENKLAILAQACDPDFLSYVGQFMIELATREYKDKPYEFDGFLLNVLCFTKGVMILLPNTASERFKAILLYMESAMKGMEEYQNTPVKDDVKQLHQNLKLQLNESAIERNDKKINLSSKAELLSAQPPPNDFRDLNLIPTSEDIFSEETAFVRPNLVRGAYESIEHYLDVQFRLLHEDFLSPMREGIIEYVEKVGTQKMRKARPITNVRLYRKVMFLNPKIVTDRIGIVVNFDPEKRLKKVQWRHSKRFMYGSLLCFTQDNFRNIMFGTVVEREDKDLHHGRVVVQLCVGTQIREDLFREEFTMAESEVYFEPYYQVLKALQDMKEEVFPMKQYIVNAQSEGHPPAYLLTVPGIEYTMEPGFKLPVLLPELWPSAEELNLDDSQYRAFRFALTKEFVVIQGPPGTGKTYLGLKVVGVLLENHIVWHEKRQPILVVCYTNHALDQFLEGLLQYTNKIVRIGGQSRSDILHQYTLKEVRNEYKKKLYKSSIDSEEETFRTRMRNNNNLGRDIHDRMKVVAMKINKIQLDLESLQSNKGIISLEYLFSIGAVNPNYYRAFKDDKEEAFVEWLLSQQEYYDPSYLPIIKADEEVVEENGDAVADVDEEIGGRVARDIDEGFDLDIEHVKGDLSYADNFETLRMKERDVSKELYSIINEGENSQQSGKMWILDTRLSDIHHKLQRMEERLKEVRIVNHTELQKILRERNIWNLNFNDRWILYRHWISELRDKLLENFRELEVDFRTEAKQYEEVRHMMDLEIMRESYVIGMTTTGAARLQPLLQALKPKIVIVEEAAEVLESHITVSLTSHCQHLILIGDHQQLRPSTSVYKLAKEFSLDVSLFERMLNNGMHCEVLKVQHRMRPEIARLIVPAIYPELLNHRSVTHFEEIRGLTKSLFFIDHSFPDEEVGDTLSRRNVHEGDFIVAFCRHLILQGYEPNAITILATYTAQMFYIKNESKKYELLRDVRITVVDNFQGEENDIILLSLVRSNEQANIGFLKIENRVCVALSRAKKGMYIMGNMENLIRSSDIWPKIEEVLAMQHSVGHHLELKCQVHPVQMRRVSKAEDFSEIPEGGCLLICDAPLKCGHRCQAVCHVRDREHEKYKCLIQPCDKVMCGLGHKCQKVCYEECGECMVMVHRKLPCGHEKELMCYVDYEKHPCQVLVERELPACKHKIPVPCSQNPAQYTCPVPCDARLDDCGHTCRRNCHVENDPDHLDYQCDQPCPRTNAGCSQNHACIKQCYEDCGLCKVPVRKALPACGHKFEMPCSQEPATFACSKKCERTMDCGHRCQKKCSDTCGDCSKVVNKIIPGCEHEIKLRCCTTPARAMCQRPCERLLKCGHKCTFMCKEKCVVQCKEMVASDVKAACGHQVNLPCHKKPSGLVPPAEELLSYCNAPCGVELKCKHICEGTCNSCLQGRVHMPCKQKCGKTLICGHSCDTPCSVTCPPCKKNCMMKCVHNRCKKKCGQPCTPCSEICSWKCEHYKCTKRCSEPCNRPACYEPCKKNKRKCGHPCIGFCGEYCPPLCRICNKEEVTTVFFGFEDEEDARFVFLEDCRHTVESRGLEKWLQTSDGEIKMPTCPICKTAITKNTRFSHIIRPQYYAVCGVKTKVFGEINRIEHARKQYIEKLKAIPTFTEQVQPVPQLPMVGRYRTRVQAKNVLVKTFPKLLTESKIFIPIYSRILDSFSIRTKNNKKNVLSNVDMETLGIQSEILCELAAKVKKIEHYLNSSSQYKLLKQIYLILAVLDSRGTYLSSQEVNDLNLEMQRFHRIADTCVLESLPTFQYLSQVTKENYETELVKKLITIEKYSVEMDQTIKNVQDRLAKDLKMKEVLVQEERRQIVKAVGLKQGHWFKCPNGHFYAIGDCGGAVRTGRCVECKANIGGTNYRLLPGNNLASEIDGARFSAYSNAANMANFHRDDDFFLD